LHGGCEHNASLKLGVGGHQSIAGMCETHQSCTSWE
jgi:hypothetical protein